MWQRRAASYIKDNLGEGELGRFLRDAEVQPPSGSFPTVGHADVFRWTHDRLYWLDKFITESKMKTIS